MEFNNLNIIFFDNESDAAACANEYGGIVCSLNNSALKSDYMHYARSVCSKSDEYIESHPYCVVFAINNPIRYIPGTVLEADTEVIVNQINCCGIIPPDISKAFQKYQDAFRIYAKACDDAEMDANKLLGHNIYYKDFDKIFCLCFAQDKYYGNQNNTEYDKLALCLQDIANRYAGKSIAIPMNMGCNKYSNGNWDIIIHLIFDYLIVRGKCEVYICLER